MKIIHFLFLFLISINLYSNQEILSLGFGSCLHQDRNMAILKTIEKKELDLFMFIGDNVYGDQEEGELDKLIRTYKKQYKNLENFLNNVETEFIWDDHDFGLNDGGSNYRYKDKAKELFLKTWQIPDNDPRRLRDGLYFDKKFTKNGLNVHLIFLDIYVFNYLLWNIKIFKVINFFIFFIFTSKYFISCFNNNIIY